MHIAILAHSYIPDIGGSEEVIRNLAREFNILNRVTIIVFTVRRWSKAHEIIEGIDVYRINAPFLIFPRRGFCRIIDTLKLFVTLPFVLIKLNSILRATNSEIVNITYIGINAFYVWCLSFFVPLKYIVNLQGFNIQVLPFLKGIRGFIARFIYRAILNKANFVIACSEFLLNDALDKTHLIKNKSMVIFNGINIEEFKQNSQALIKYPYILCLGRLQAPSKGFDLALLALKDILDRGFDINLVLAGDGLARLDYEEFAKLLGVEKRVYFFGPADRSQVVNLFKNCQFFVMPSRIEPFGIVNLEAMAAGKAVVASRSGGIPEVVEDEVTGLLVEPNNEKALAESIKRLLLDRDLRETLGRNGRSKIEEGVFSWSVIAKRYLELYAKFL
jgi:glycosyltransferase involved in cell wall biosynthesis